MLLEKCQVQDFPSPRAPRMSLSIIASPGSMPQDLVKGTTDDLRLAEAVVAGEGGVGREHPALEVEDRDPVLDLLDGNGQAQAFLLGGLERGDVPGGGEDTDRRAGLIPEDDRVVEDLGHLPRHVADGQGVVPDRSLREDLLVSFPRLGGFREIIGEVAAR